VISPTSRGLDKAPTTLVAQVSYRLTRNSQLLLLALAMAAGGYVRTTVGPIQEAIRTALAFSDDQMALLQGPALGIPMVLAAIPLGMAIDRFSRFRLLFILAVLSVLGTLWSASAESFAPLFAARCLAGLAGYSVVAIVMSLLADLYSPCERGRVTMVVSIGQLGGVSGAFALGGALLSRHGGGAEGWHWTMLCLAVPLVPVSRPVLPHYARSCRGFGPIVAP
jgi:MFS family permease